MKKTCTLALATYIIAVSIAPITIYADTGSNTTSGNSVATYTLLEPLPCLNDGTQKCTDGGIVTQVNFADYVRYMFNLIIALSAVAAVLVIVAGGFKYVTTDSFQGKNDGKKMILEALKGLLLVLCSYLILRTIDPRLVDIPSTIVKPLPISYQKGVTYGYFDQLASEASKYNANDRAAVLAREVAKKQTQDLKNQLDIIDEKLGKIYSGDAEATQEEINSLSKQRALISDQINGTISEATIQNAIAIYNAQMRNVVDPKDEVTLDTIEAYLNNIQKVNASTQEQLNKNLNEETPEQKEKLANEKSYSEARILIVKYEHFTTSLDPKAVDAAIAKLNSLKTTTIASITDKTRRDELTSAADKAIESLKASISTDAYDGGVMY
ncbi:MAG: hypothetical protein RLY66_72 [Candidatus Parcubacteria bacterium]|jgi:hypothetical protein